MLSVSVILPTFNSFRTIDSCLKSIRAQDYDQNKLEILAVDGGSDDGTVALVKQYGGRIIRENSSNPEKAKAIALKQAKSDLILLMASDNVLPTRSWLRELIVALKQEPAAVAAYPWRYTYQKQDSSLNRYFALLGANDPVAWWLNKADRQEYGSNQWRLSGQALDKGTYFLVSFNQHSLPTVGDNGMLVWRKKLLQAQIEPKYFSHIDVFLDLVNLGLNQFVVIKNTIIHDTGQEYGSFLVKRFRYMKRLYLNQLEMRRFRWIKSKSDKIKLIAYLIYSFTFIGPFIYAIRGIKSKFDLAWFWHPIMCPSMALIYGLAIIQKTAKQRVISLKQKSLV